MNTTRIIDATPMARLTGSFWSGKRAALMISILLLILALVEGIATSNERDGHRVVALSGLTLFIAFSVLAVDSNLSMPSMVVGVFGYVGMTAMMFFDPAGLLNILGEEHAAPIAMFFASLLAPALLSGLALVSMDVPYFRLQPARIRSSLDRFLTAELGRSVIWVYGSVLWRLFAGIAFVFSLYVLAWSFDKSGDSFAEAAEWLGLIAQGLLAVALCFYLCLKEVLFATGMNSVLAVAVLVGVSGLALFYVATIFVRYALRFVRRDARRALSRDVALPVLLLRSFADDSARVRPTSLVKRLQLRRLRLEEVIASGLRSVGPFIAIGRPGEKLPLLGAHRAYFGDNEWQAAVRNWIDRSRIILMVAGTTPWVRWELSEILERQALGKLVVLLPPGDWEDTASRLTYIATSLNIAGLQDRLPTIGSNEVLALFFTDGQPSFVLAHRKTQFAYEAAITLALFGLLLHRDVHVRPEQSSEVTRHQAAAFIWTGRALAAVGATASFVWALLLFGSMPF